MQSVQRRVGKIVNKSPGDNAKVSVLLQDFANAEQVLTGIIETSVAWREAWISVLTVQLSMATEFEELYHPIVGATSDGYGHEPVETPEYQLNRTRNLRQAYAELKADLLEEVNMVDSRIVRPAMSARDCIKPLKKTIKSRDNKRLDYENYQDRLDKKRKQKRTEKDEAAYVKLEGDLDKAAAEFHYADDHLREALPPLIAATFSLLPHLLAALVMTQNTLLAQYYTCLHNYCTDEGFPSPPPPIEHIVADWEGDFKSIQQTFESMHIIARGKTVHSPMGLGDDASAPQGSSVTGLNLRNNLAARRTNSQANPSASDGSTVKSSVAGLRSMGSSAVSSVSSAYPRKGESNRPPEEHDSDRNSGSPNDQGPNVSAGPVRNNMRESEDQPDRSAVSVIAGQKKPAPPPMKRHQSKEIWVTSLYEFAGQEDGDLSFEEGDRIKVIKRTDSLDDWWDGELRGVRGRFPANFVEYDGTLPLVGR